VQVDRPALLVAAHIGKRSSVLLSLPSTDRS